MYAREWPRPNVRLCKSGFSIQLNFQAPPELRKFIQDHKLGQRSQSNGQPQEFLASHQVCNLITAEIKIINSCPLANGHVK